MLIQQAEEIDYSGHRGRLSTFVTRKRIVPPSSQPRGGNLAQPEFLPDAADLFTLHRSLTEHQLVARRRVSLRAAGIEFNFAAVTAAPPGKSINFDGLSSMVDGESLVFETGHSLAGFTVQTYARHAHLSLN
jgi:hypothetical protein